MSVKLYTSRNKPKSNSIESYEKKSMDWEQVIGDECFDKQLVKLTMNGVTNIVELCFPRKTK